MERWQTDGGYIRQADGIVDVTDEKKSRMNIWINREYFYIRPFIRE